METKQYKTNKQTNTRVVSLTDCVYVCACVYYLVDDDCIMCMEGSTWKAIKRSFENQIEYRLSVDAIIEFW